MQPTVIDLFCGAGGLSLGFEAAGFAVLAGNDSFEAAGRSFQSAHPRAKFFAGNVENLQVEAILAETGLRRGDLTVLAGGPPCQAYSVYNHQRGMHDDRASLFKEYLRVVEGLQPEWIVMENVTGIYSVAEGHAVQTIKSELSQLGYSVADAVLKSEEFGVPQERRRVFFVGNRQGKQNRHPIPHFGPGRENPFTTVRDALGDLPELKNGESLERVAFPLRTLTDYQREMRGNATTVANHSAPRLGKVNLERLPHIPPGGSWRDIPVELLPSGMKRAKRSDHTKRYGRMTWDGLSCTILTKCDIHWGAYIHPDQDRAISVREAARLQSFPDWFEFHGSKTEQYVQVGNAVPPRLARAVADCMMEEISKVNAVAA